MLLTFEPMDEASARFILAWHYEPPYSFYNPDAVEIERDLSVWLDPANAYYAIRDEDGLLVAYQTFGADAQVPGGDYSADALDLGGGMRPDLTGRGLGLELIETGLEFGRKRFAPAAFRLTVAEWNERALRVCERAGFQVVQRFKSPRGEMFCVLLREE